MKIRVIEIALLGIALALAGCRDPESGPVTISAIGMGPQLVNPNLDLLEPPSALLIEAVAQGLVRFDSSGQIEPALAQSWIVSDDGLRYTFRLAEAEWSNGAPVTAKQVAERLLAARSRASRNALKPLLGAIGEIEAMTDDVIEISLATPRHNFLQLLAQPELAILYKGHGTGPYRARPQEDGALLLTMHEEDDQREEEEEEAGPHGPDLILRGETAARAVARFKLGGAHLVTGGTIGDLPIARASGLPAAALRFDPTAGLFGLIFTAGDGLWSNATARQALSMAIDRPALIAALGVPDLQPRLSLVPPGVEELPDPAMPDWAANPQPPRRERAAAAIAGLRGDDTPTVRVAIPDSPGYDLLFAHLRRDWRAIGVDAQRVAPPGKADVRLIDEVAPVGFASWYLRHFECAGNSACSAEADAALDLARSAPTAAERQTQLALADRLLTESAVFIPITAPVRWSLVSGRLTGFQSNPFGRRFPGGLITAPQ